MAITARYEEPTQVVETAAMKARIKDIADREGISFAQVVRDMTRYAIGWRENAGAEELLRLRLEA